jgi:hypothetical protein
MTEQVPPHGPEEIVDDPESGHAADDVVTDAKRPIDEAGSDMQDEPVRTGMSAVDDVLAEIDGLDDQPLEQHLATFERAHNVLRSALDAEPDDPA